MHRKVGGVQELWSKTEKFEQCKEDDIIACTINLNVLCLSKHFLCSIDSESSRLRSSPRPVPALIHAFRPRLIRSRVFQTQSTSTPSSTATRPRRPSTTPRTSCTTWLPREHPVRCDCSCSSVKRNSMQHLLSRALNQDRLDILLDPV